jgi:spore coat protein CotF
MDLMRLDDKDIMTDCLNSAKFVSTNYHKAILEASNDNIRNTFFRMHNGTLAMQKTLFDLMHQRGWYQVEPATGVGAQMQPQMQHQAPHHYRPEMQQFQSPNPNQPGF